MKKLNKFLATVLAVVMVLTAAPLSGFVGIELPNLFSLLASAETVSGTIGTEGAISWSYDTETRELVISGTGEMYDWDGYFSFAPWYNDKSSIKSIIIGNGVTSIGSYAFEGCTSLTSVTIPDSVTIIYGSAFEGCTSLTSVTIPGSVTSIEKGAFSGTAYSNDEKNWENGVLYISNHLIAVNTSIPQVYTIKNNTKTIANNAFETCYHLTSVIMPDSLIHIGDDAFNFCTSLTSVTMGVNLISIGESAFQYCSRLSNITIPSKVTSIGKYAFSGCTDLKSAIFEDTSTWYYVKYLDDFTNKTNGTLIELSNNEDNAAYISEYAYYSKYYLYKL